MGTINTTDIMFATVTRSGATIYQGRIMGVSSMSDIIRRLRSALNNAAGRFCLNLRNGTQGWSQSTSFVLAPTTIEGTQLTLF